MSEAGDRITFDGQRFTCIGIEPHRSVDGRQTHYSVWESKCVREDCTNIFTQGFPPNFPRYPQKLNRRCDVHKQPGKRVTPSKKGSRRELKESIAAAEWLYRVCLMSGSDRWTVKDATQAVQAAAVILPEALAVSLGVYADQPQSKRRAIIRRLDLATRMGMLDQMEDAKGTFWINTVFRLDPTDPA